jgi:hypothetical protein
VNGDFTAERFNVPKLEALDSLRENGLHHRRSLVGELAGRPSTPKDPHAARASREQNARADPR